MQDTIFALSSGHVPAGVAVMRLSGPLAVNILAGMTGDCPPVRTAVLRSLRLPDSTLLDRALVLYFQAPSSFTGEDVVELHLHGSRAVVSGLLAYLGAIPNVRQAEAGEFTRRAFLNGKLDLVGVEGLADLLSAETEAQRRFALENSGAAQSKTYDGWRQRLIHARAMIEAELDFSDEGDVPGSIAEEVWADIGLLKQQMTEHIAGFGRAEIVRDGFRVVLTGPPNAGKSSLLNALARRDVAIVSEEPGTTRDVLEVALDLNGFKVTLIDTAGIRSDARGVEAMGIERAHDELSRAHLVVALNGADQIPSPLPQCSARVVSVRSKSDLDLDRLGLFDLEVSAETGEGLDLLLELIGREARAGAGDIKSILPSRQRHVDIVRMATLDLDSSLDADADIELRAEALRTATATIGRIIGHVGTEEVLGHIFSSFCIGK